MSPAEFRAWAERLGLGRLTDADLEALRRGFAGMQPQLDRLREELTPQDQPPRPPLGVEG
ncbi:hypothetical protein [Roseomonas sp. BN140053]|uniref:hypothetical protein n=1 Tax=Roseomonas sp. BN140053 TaxID=3391898 RepID=UPI0039E7350C